MLETRLCNFWPKYHSSLQRHTGRNSKLQERDMLNIIPRPFVALLERWNWLGRHGHEKQRRGIKGGVGGKYGIHRLGPPRRPFYDGSYKARTRRGSRESRLAAGPVYGMAAQGRANDGGSDGHQSQSRRTVRGGRRNGKRCAREALCGWVKGNVWSRRGVVGRWERGCRWAKSAVNTVPHPLSYTLPIPVKYFKALRIHQVANQNQPPLPERGDTKGRHRRDIVSPESSSHAEQKATTDSQLFVVPLIREVTGLRSRGMFWFQDLDRRHPEKVVLGS
ncbi:hypothetical protein FB451DRAFT_1443323 [Mycena latifolia]|nr:hypothetical protein FB451DRAFT_1443323 [Mycena latifolia]